MSDPSGQPGLGTPWSTEPSDTDASAFPSVDPQDATRPYSSQPATPAHGMPAQYAPPLPSPELGPFAPQGPYQQQGSYPSPGPYQQPNPYAPQGPYGAQGLYQQQGPYAPQGPYQQQGPYAPQGPYGPPTYPPAWASRPPSGFPPPGSLPPRRRGPNGLTVLLIVLLTIATIGGGTAWYLLLFAPKNAPTSSPTPRVAAVSPTPRSTATTRPTAAPTLASKAPATPDATPFITQPPTVPPSPAGATASPSSAPSAPRGSGAPAASVEPAIVAQIDQVISEVPGVRGLQPTRSVPYRFITRDQFLQQFTQQFEKDNPPDQLKAEEALDKRLGLLPADADLGALIKALYTSQVLAFYDPETKDFTVIQSATGDFTPSDRVTVAHEYDHALQDQRWDLTKLQKIDPSEGDRAVAITTLAEGDATLLMYQWAGQYLTPAEFGSLGNSVTPEDQALLDSMPLVLRQSLMFPYISGLQFILGMEQSGGWDAVNAVWDNPPVSSEQIMHPEKYTAGEQPVAVALPDVAAMLGQGWTAATTDTEGELGTGIWLADGKDGGTGALGLPAPLPNADAAAGWGGDRLVSLEGPNGTWAVVWQTAWDTPSDATEFSAAATGVMVDLPGAHAVIAKSLVAGIVTPELVLVASDQATLDAVKTQLAVGN